jgi:hypothetical protein
MNNSDTFRHASFFIAVLLLIGAWKFGLEGVFE